jgi:4-diphosphocytidyl-2-C-methyl-D-erythritol kinase
LTAFWMRKRPTSERRGIDRRAPVSVTEFAPAKINLTLHVTGRHANGYHSLDSLVVFADVGDRITVSAGQRTELTVTGPRAAGVPTGDGNLVLRAAAAMRAGGVSVVLEKHLPLASGIGGGSSDAAATLRAIARQVGCPMPEAGTLLELGSDVPVCLAARPARMRGVGGALSELPQLPRAWLVLVNPGVQVSTRAVFSSLDGACNAPMADVLPRWSDAASMAAWLAEQRNDLQDAAIGLAPVIEKTRDRIAAQPGCLLARMSGSGATCFGLFADQARAGSAAAALRSTHPDWWIAAARMLS